MQQQEGKAQSQRQSRKCQREEGMGCGSVVSVGGCGWLCGCAGIEANTEGVRVGQRAAMEAERNGWVSPAASGGDGRAKSQTWR